MSVRPSSCLLPALVLLVLGCGGPADPCRGRQPPADAAAGAYVTEVVREEGRTVVRFRDGGRVVLPAWPTRIVTTLPGLTEIVVALGGVDRLVGVSVNCDLPEVADLPRLAVFPLDVETLVALHPDLLLVDAVVGSPDLDAAALGRGIAVLPTESRSLAHLDRTLALVGEVLGTPEARERAAAFTAELGRARAAVAPNPSSADPTRVLLLAQADPVYVLGPGSLLDDMVRACGAVNVACDLGRPSGPFAEELVLARRPDVILVLEGRMPSLQRLARWTRVPAVEHGRVVDLGADAFVRAGPRTPAALLRLAGALRGRDALGAAKEPR